MLDRLARPRPAARSLCVDPRDTPVGARGRRPPGAAPGTNLALLNGLLHELIANDWVDEASSPRTRSDSTRCEKIVARLHAGAGGARSAASRPRDVRAGGPDLGTPSACSRPCCRASTSPTRRPPRPCQVNNVNLLRGHDRAARLRHPADERPADRAEHPRDAAPTATCPASATGRTRRTSRSSPSSGTSSRRRSRTGRRRRTRCRSSATPSRARSSSSGSRRRTRPSRCPSSAASARSSRRTSCSSSSRTSS